MLRLRLRWRSLSLSLDVERGKSLHITRASVELHQQRRVATRRDLGQEKKTRPILSPSLLIFTRQAPFCYSVSQKGETHKYFLRLTVLMSYSRFK